MVFVTRNEVVDSDSCVSVAACWCHDRSYIVLRVAGCDGMRVCEYQPSDPMIFPVGSFLVSKHFKTAYATGGNRYGLRMLLPPVGSRFTPQVWARHEGEDEAPPSKGWKAASVKRVACRERHENIRPRLLHFESPSFTFITS